MDSNRTAPLNIDDSFAPGFLVSDDARSLLMFQLGTNLVVCFWHAAPTDVALAHLRQHLRSLADAQKGAFSMLHVVSDSVPTLPDYARSAFVEIMREHSERLACIGVVLEGSGFWAGLMQSITTGMRLLARGSFPLYVDGSVEGIAGRVSAAHRRATRPALNEATLLAMLSLAREDAQQRLS